MTQDIGKKNAELPEHTAQRLRDLRETDDVEFLAMVLALREKKWPLRTLGDAFGVTRAAAQNWVSRAKRTVEAVEKAPHFVRSVPDLPVTARGSELKLKKLVPDVPERDRERIKQLTEEASTVKRWTPLDAPSRKAAFELEDLLYFYATERRVPLTRLAAHAGVTRRAVAQRIEKQKSRLTA